MAEHSTALKNLPEGSAGMTRDVQNRAHPLVVSLLHEMSSRWSHLSSVVNLLPEFRDPLSDWVN